MPDIIQNAKQFRADKPWGARDIAEIDSATVRLHWADAPYKWHVNDGTEVFAVIDGDVLMRYRDAGQEKSISLKPGDIFVAGVGDEHIAEPVGEARVLVIERKGSI